MALVRILVDGYSLLHGWPQLAPGWPRHSAHAREELIQALTHYQDSTGVPVTVVFDGISGQIDPEASPGEADVVEVLFSKTGQSADQVIERAAHRLRKHGEVMVVTDDFAESTLVAGMNCSPRSCANFVQELSDALNELERRLRSHNDRESSRFKNS